jgi:catechol 2,3-dioxygenase-like lactoylglutathione lyase family enzyme
MKIEKIHHVAYRCQDAKETVLWYRRHAQPGARN